MRNARRRDLGIINMTLDYYNFNHTPFSPTPDLDRLFLTPSHHAALMAMLDGAQTRSGLVVITGQEGIGKTTLLRAFLHRADPKTLKTLCIPPPTVAYPDLVAVVARALGLEAPTDDLDALLAQLHAALRREYQAGRNMVLVIDEAQRMPLDTLASLSRLVTLETSNVKLLQIVMAGSLELQKKLNQKALRTLKRHVAVHATMFPLTKTESIAYLRDQLAKATEEPDTIVSLKGLKRIVKRAGGIPRILNILCVDALQMGAYYYEQPVSAKTVKYAVAGQTSLRPRPSRWLIATIGTAAATVVLGLLWFSLPKPFTRATPPTSVSQPRTETADGQAKVLEVIRPDPLLALLQQSSNPEAASQLDRVSSPPPQPPLERQPETPHPEPHSELTQRVVELMRHHFPNGGAFPLRVWVNKGSQEVFTEGENLLVHVWSEQSAHLHMDYYQADGQVVHLLPHPLDPNRVEAGEIVSWGKPDNTFQFTVAPPFGVEMLTVVASRSPLDTRQGGPPVEPAAPYLERLGKRLEAYKAQGNAAIAHVRIRTQKSP
jgi:type II secretory pathway predicted ATPase ExeA